MIGLVLAALVMVLVLSGGASRPSEDPAPGARETFVGSGPAEVDTPAPDFALPGLDGGMVTLARQAGKPVIVNFWASWCNPCRKEFPLLRAARAQHARDGLVIIGVSYRDIASDARAFVRTRSADWAFARDPGGKLARAYGVRAVPQTFFLDRNGTIVSRRFGITSADELETEIQKILDPEPVTPPSGRPGPRAAERPPPTARAR